MEQAERRECIGPRAICKALGAQTEALIEIPIKRATRRHIKKHAILRQFFSAFLCIIFFFFNYFGFRLGLIKESNKPITILKKRTNTSAARSDS